MTVELPAGVDPEEFKKWPASAQQKALAMLQDRKNPPQIWYCTRGRMCDGKPHDGANYPHARSDQWPPEGVDWFSWLLLSGRGAGKALDVDTPILTTQGWSTMGKLQAGDSVFDENGSPTTVLIAHDPYTPESAYRVNLSDGTAVDADRDHLWVTWTHADRKRFLRDTPRDRFPLDWADKEFVTTAEMYATQTHGKRGDRNHCIPLAGPIDLPEADLPIHPYALGAWLGDGSSGGAEFTVADSDRADMADLLALSGEPLTGGRRKEGSACQTYGMGVRLPVRSVVTGKMEANGSLASRLRTLNLLRNKHIPPRYLSASIDQRLALLRGLMDTDGCADDRKSTVEFCSTSRPLAEGVLELARSLSERPVLAEGRARLNGVDCGPKYRVTWRPSLFVPFSLMRKAALIKPAGRQALRLRHRMVTSVQPISAPTVRCITVDSPTSMYLAGRGLIPTHNTRSGAEWLRKMSQHAPRMAMVGRRGPDVRGTMVEGPSGLIYACERAGMSYTWEPSKKEFTFGNGAKVIGYSAEEPDTLRGPQHGVAWLDEPAHMPLIDAVWDNLLLGLRLDIPGGSKVLVTSTPTPIKWLKELVKDEKSRVIRVSTYKNLSNLDPNFRDNILKKYEGTRLGRQELHGEILQDVEGALWSWDLIERNRHDPGMALEEFVNTMDRVVVGVDPAGTSRRKSDETGIVVVGKKGDVLYVIQDASGHYTPERWARRAMDVHDHWNADAIVVENNYGGEMVRAVMDNISKFPRIKEVNSTRGKLIRAEPIFSLYEQCVAEGALVSTRRGEVPIEDVLAGDEVATRRGWRRVTWSGQTGVSPVIEIRTESGHALRLTDDHRVWTENRGWVSAGSLVPTDRLLTCHTSRTPVSTAQPLLDGVGRAANRVQRVIDGRRREPLSAGTSIFEAPGTTSRKTGTGAPRGMQETNSSTVLSGAPTWEPFPLDGTSTTEITTGATTASTTWSQDRPPITPSTTTRQDSEQRSSKDSSAPVESAGRDSLHDSPGQASAPISADACVTHVQSVIEGVGFEKVYDLTVEEDEEFFADGILVHNCLVKHVRDLADLETQLTEWIPGSRESPDRLDAMVHAAHELSGGTRPAGVQTASGTVVRGNGRRRSKVNAHVSSPGRLSRPTVRSWL